MTCACGRRKALSGQGDMCRVCYHERRKERDRLRKLSPSVEVKFQAAVAAIKARRIDDGRRTDRRAA
jgi:hypothetical protein